MSQDKKLTEDKIKQKKYGKFEDIPQVEDSGKKKSEEESIQEGRLPKIARMKDLSMDDIKKMSTQEIGDLLM